MPFGKVAGEEVCYKTKWIKGTAYAVMDKLGTPEDFGEESLPIQVVREGDTPFPPAPPGLLNYIDPNKYQEEWIMCIHSKYHEKCSCEGSAPAPEGEDVLPDIFGGASYQAGPCGRSDKERKRAKQNCKCNGIEFEWSQRRGGSNPRDYPAYGYEINFCCELEAKQIRGCTGDTTTGLQEPHPTGIGIPCSCNKSIKLPNFTHIHIVERGDSIHGGDVWGSFNPPQLPYAWQQPQNVVESREKMLCSIKGAVLDLLESEWGKVKDISICGRCDEFGGGSYHFDQDAEPGEGGNKDRCEGYPKGEAPYYGS